MPLAIGWFFLAFLSVTTLIVRLGGVEGDARFAIASIAAQQALFSALFYVGVGLTYWLARKAAASTAVVVIGGVHLLFALISLGARFRAGLMQDQMIASRDMPDTETMALFYAAAGFASTVGGVLLIVALIIALASTPTPGAAEETFD